ncbi:MAG TPA: hypothetical protein G4N94_03170 [Caldilineae bacterium]|nr:hypothetical protein [Caldilineae bacterium]
MTSTQVNNTKTQLSQKLPLIAVAVIVAGLFLLALGYWGAWLPHPAAGLNILGIDLAEYVKFVPEVTSGQIPIKREVFFYPLLSLAVGLILLGTIHRPALPLWLRAIFVVLAAPTALAMLPPAWTPALLRTPEFRQQTLTIVFLLLAALFSPLIHRYLPDWWRGALLVLLGAIPFQALIAYTSLLPALEKLYQQPLEPGTAYYLVAAGAILLGLGGIFVVIGQRRQRTATAV